MNHAQFQELVADTYVAAEPRLKPYVDEALEKPRIHTLVRRPHYCRHEVRLHPTSWGLQVDQGRELAETTSGAALFLEYDDGRDAFGFLSYGFDTVTGFYQIPPFAGPPMEIIQLPSGMKLKEAVRKFVAWELDVHPPDFNNNP